NAMLAGVLPTPAVALLALDLGAVISASHNPPEYNGVKLFDGDGQKLTDAAEEEIEALLGKSPQDAETGRIDNLDVVHGSYVDHVIERFGEDVEGLRIGVDCANGAYSGMAPAAFERLGATVAVTTMANLGLHRLMAERGVRVVTTDVGDRYVLEALRREGGVLGGEQSGHLIYLDGHVTGDGLVAALLLCRSLRGRRLSEAAAVMPRFPQAMQNVRVAHKQLTPAIGEAVERINSELAGRGRILVR